MELSDQVCSLELAKRLKELGVKQYSIFCWFRCGGDQFELDYNIHEDIENYPNEYISAFTVAELGEILPDWFDSGRRADKDWMCRVLSQNNHRALHSFGKIEANARAKMLIYLIENKLMELPNE